MVRNCLGLMFNTAMLSSSIDLSDPNYGNRESAYAFKCLILARCTVSNSNSNSLMRCPASFPDVSDTVSIHLRALSSVFTVNRLLSMYS